MVEVKRYSAIRFEKAVSEIIEVIDRDVERGEDILMLGFCVVMMSSFFAILAPPTVLLPLVALTFALSAGFARRNYHRMGRKLTEAMARLEGYDKSILHPIAAVFAERPMESLAVSFNPLKNLKRTGRSALGGLLINPLWAPIFYMMGMQITEEKNLVLLNQAIFEVEQKLSTASTIVL